MKKISLFIGISLMALSCSQLLKEPKNLVPKQKMSEIIAELAISDQLSYIGQPTNMETQTRFILKKYGVKGTDFSESYKYYLADKDLQEIYDDAQEIILNKDPKGKKYIEDKLKQEAAKSATMGPPQAH